jgi:hypothetical protein
MPDICDLILDDHEVFRRRFAELDDNRHAPANTLDRLWRPLAEMLDRHADAEETLFYPKLLHAGDRADDETVDAVRDHNKIRDAVHRSHGLETGTDQWWDAVMEARKENSTHMGEEEREPLADFRCNVDVSARAALGNRWVEFNDEHAGGRDVDRHDKDPQEYVEHHSG